MTLVLRSRGCQIVAVVVAFVAVATLHRHNDGLWFQGDAPRHAVNGFFWWDLVHALPRDPLAYAVRYYARYPVIAPVTYPPLFYLVEGLAFATFGSSPHVAKSVVLVFAILTGLYTMAWARHWIGEPAGWAGAFLAFIPGMVLWSNTVMLNVPATALSLGSLYHFRRWLESGQTKQLAWTLGLVAAALVTYYPSVSLLSILTAWSLFRVRDVRFDRRVFWIAAGALLALAPLGGAMLLAPLHTSRHLPSFASLTRAETWTYYWMALPDLVGGMALWLGVAGCAVSLLVERWRVEVVYLAVWIVVLIASLSVLPAEDPRYILLVAPAFVLAAAIGIAVCARHVRRAAPTYQAALLGASLGLGLYSTHRVDVPQVTGVREMATFLRQRAPSDAVLYDGDHDGLFGFYVRALDPGFERRIVLANRLFYSYGPDASFEWTQTLAVASVDDLVDLMRSKSGCRWVAIETGPKPPRVRARRLLAEAVTRPEFEFVRSFPIMGAGVRRVDLYRMVNDVQPVTAVDLRFPSLTNRPFMQVSPITR